MQPTSQIPNCGTLDIPYNNIFSMLSLSASQLSEIAPFPDLRSLVEQNAIAPNKIQEFNELCAVHNCFDSFMRSLPHSSVAKSPLTLLARLDRWNLVEQMDLTEFSTINWKNVIRRAGKAGHMEFVNNVLEICEDKDLFVRAAITGASMNDQLKILQHFLPDITDHGFVGHIAVTAAQHGSIHCVRYCLDRITPQQWLGTLSSTVNTHRSEMKVANMLLENMPSDCPITPVWCTKFAKRLAYGSIKDSENVWRLLCEHMERDDLVKITAHWSDERKQNLYDIHQNVVLMSYTNCGVSTAKRKM